MRREEGIIAGLLVLIGILGLIPQWLHGGPWSGEATLAAIMLCLGVLALVVELGPRLHRGTK